MATQIVPAPASAERTTAPLPWAASDAMRSLELKLAAETVANFDEYGSVWGFNTVAEAEAEIAQDRAEGATVEVWETADRDGQPLRVARVTHPKWGMDIRVTSTWRTGKATR
ncbi:hypothetical protein [Streptomyces sp. NPDC093060]|uniref:hypothetical protein n=1 Tax=Streptomyces sp. NPDC093060 TaxID=3366019 RepID=UPI00382BEB0A